jgi:thiol-disulfide isomerase/thioredoxin
MKKVRFQLLSKLSLSLFSFLLCCSSQSFAEQNQVLPISSVAGLEQTIEFKAYTGKVILIDFWASWCGPCRQSFPWMNDMQAKYKEQGFEIIAINLDNEQKQAFDFLTEIPANFTLGFDPEGLSAEKMDVEAMPMSYLVDRQGRIRQRMLGFNTSKKAEHEAYIQTLLTETK